MKHRGQVVAALVALACAPIVGIPHAQAASDEGTNTLTLTDGRGNLTESAKTVARAVDGVPAGDAPSKDAATATPGVADYADYLYMSEPLDATRFSIAGLTWNAGEKLPDGSVVEMRTLDGGTWSPWYALEVEDDEGGRPGTEANVSGSSTGIQIRITGKGELPAGLRVSMVHGEGDVEEIEPEVAPVEPVAGSETSDVVNPEVKAFASVLPGTDGADKSADSVTSNASATGTVRTPATGTTPSNLAAMEIPEATVPVAGEATPAVLVSHGSGMVAGLRPAALTADQTAAAKALANIQPRSAWGADEKLMTWDPQYAKLEGAIIHHTAGSNTYTQAGVPAVIRSIYQYHAVSRQWGDIGYNVLVDRFGGRWEGRKGTLSSQPGMMVIGGHAQPMNTGTIGVSVMGNYSGNVIPSATVLDTLSDIIAGEFAIAGIDPASKSPLKVPSTSPTMTAGTTLPRIVGHKDVNSTACPANIYPKLGVIRDAVAEKYGKVVNTTPMTASLSAVQELESVTVTATLHDSETQWPRFRWFSYNTATGEWNIESDWSWSPTFEWRATTGVYWLQLQVGAADTGRTIYTQTIPFSYQAGTARIEGTYAGPGQGGILLGNYAPKAGYVVTKIYDVGRGTWVDQFRGPWAVWKPVKGVYWTHFEAYTSDGRLVDTKTYPFGVN